VTKFVPHKTLKLIARAKLTFDERCVVHRVVGFKFQGLGVRVKGLVVGCNGLVASVVITSRPEQISDFIRANVQLE